MKAILTVGISASGKSTWAREFCAQHHYLEVNRDDIRREVFAEKRPDQAWSWSSWRFKWEDEVTKRQQWIIQDLIDCPGDYQGFVISDTNLNVARRKSLIKSLEDQGIPTEIKIFDIDLPEALARDAARAHGVGATVIARQYQEFQAWRDPPTYKPNPNLPRAVIVDLDGTLATLNGRSPYDKTGFETDTLNESVAAVIKDLWKSDWEVIIMTGRDSIVRPETEAWLAAHGIRYELLAMRPEGDTSQDAEFKRWVWESEIKDEYDVKLVIEDRPRVVRMWRERGLTVWPMASELIEF